MEHIVFLDRGTIPKHISLPPLLFPHTLDIYQSTKPSDVTERIKDATIVITNKVILDSNILKKATNLKMIAVAATGTNNIDLDFCITNKIHVSNVQGYATRSVPEHVVALIFMLKRHIHSYHNDIKNGEWDKAKQFCFFTHPISDVTGATLCIIGSGFLGQATAALAQSIGMKVIFSERKNAEEIREGYIAFSNAIKMADVISLHCPLTTETINLISEKEIEQMKSTAILINTSRGGIVDELALVKGLHTNQLGGAGVDVFTEEPATCNNPLIANMNLPNLVLTPHIAWGSDTSLTRLVERLFDNISGFVSGIAINRVI
ncbi:D-2-hydroxyacid dehydrogenase [Vibrio sp.]|nr:D-2-hydroxyacid dehydrogenase [Vibrio sp.]